MKNGALRDEIKMVMVVALRLLNALNSEDRGLKVRFSLAAIAFDRESAQLSQILSSQGKNAPSDPYYLVRLAASRGWAVPYLCGGSSLRKDNQERKGHINLREIPGTPAGCPWDTRRDKQGSTGRCPRDFLLFTIEN